MPKGSRLPHREAAFDLRNWQIDSKATAARPLRARPWRRPRDAETQDAEDQGCKCDTITFRKSFLPEFGSKSGAKRDHPETTFIVALRPVLCLLVLQAASYLLLQNNLPDK
jgi:hypothetical protein